MVKGNGKAAWAFTLIELLIGLAVVIMLLGLVAAAVDQTLSVNASSGARTAAIRQLDVTIDSLRKDIQMAQRINVASGSGFPLELTWIEWNNDVYDITYSLEGNNLRREVEVNGVTRLAATLATDITEIKVNSLPYLSGNLSISITSSLEGFKSATESRTFQVEPRTGT
jgi:type II secretory pathway pseudopilin PulG